MAGSTDDTESDALYFMECLKSIGRVMKIFLQSNPKGVNLSAIEQELGLLQDVEEFQNVQASSLDRKYNVLSLHW